MQYGNEKRDKQRRGQRAGAQTRGAAARRREAAVRREGEHAELHEDWEDTWLDGTTSFSTVRDVVETQSRGTALSQRLVGSNDRPGPGGRHRAVHRPRQRGARGLGQGPLAVGACNAMALDPADVKGITDSMSEQLLLTTVASG